MDLAGAQAGSTDAQPLGSTLHYRVDAVEVRVPASLGDIVGVTDAVTENRSLSADIAGSCHPVSSHYSIRVTDRLLILPQVTRFCRTLASSQLGHGLRYNG